MKDNEGRSRRRSIKMIIIEYRTVENVHEFDLLWRCLEGYPPKDVASLWPFCTIRLIHIIIRLSWGTRQVRRTSIIGSKRQETQTEMWIIINFYHRLLLFGNFCRSVDGWMVRYPLQKQLGRGTRRQRRNQEENQPNKNRAAKKLRWFLQRQQLFQ